MPIYHSVTDLIGRTPLRELCRYEKNHGLRATVLEMCIRDSGMTSPPWTASPRWCSVRCTTGCSAGRTGISSPFSPPRTLSLIHI